MIKELWWEPIKVAIHTGNKWITLEKNFDLATIKSKVLSVSPIGTDSLVYFIAFDIDSNDQNDVSAILNYLPEPLFVSVSGLKGWHIWVFPSRPLQLETAVEFIKIIKEKSGVKCESFPSSIRSKCIKWLLSIHPITNITESFVDITNLNSIDCNTEVILNEISLGLHRIPAELIESYVNSNIHDFELKIINKKTSSIASETKIALGLAKLCDRNITRIGEAFLCILPGHKEKNPSASFYAAENGTIVYHDFHNAKYGTKEYLTLGEVYAAIITGHVKELKRVEIARWLAKLAIHLEFDTNASRELKGKLMGLHELLEDLGVLKTTGKYKIDNDEKNVGCKQYVELQALDTFSTYLRNKYIHDKDDEYIRKASKQICSDYANIEKVWRTFCCEAIISIYANFNEVKLSSRFLAREANVHLHIANKAINFLSTIGVIEKVNGSGGIRGDRFKPCDINAEEIKQRLYLLFKDGKLDLRIFSREYVTHKLNEKIADQVFRNKKNCL